MAPSFLPHNESYKAEIEQVLPCVYKGFSEMDRLMYAENELFDRLWDSAAKVWADQFVMTATPEGLERFERLLNITANPETEDEAFRRQRIINRFSLRAPFSMPFLRKKLFEVTGGNHFTARVDYPKYTLHVRVMLTSVIVFADLREILIKIVPANMAVDLVYSKPVNGQAAIYTGIQVRHTYKRITREVAMYGMG